MIEVEDYQTWRLDNKINPDGLEFEITCKKCKSGNILLKAQDDISEGSELTGIYGDAKAIIKCKDCGNAFAIVVVNR